MPIVSDFECPSGHVTEHYCHPKQKKVSCSECGKTAKRIISLGRVNRVNESPVWIKSVLDVVDKSSTKHHVQEFVKHPSRKTYAAWMRGEGIRPMDHTEHGGPPVHRTPPDPDLSGLRNEVARKHFERKRIEI